MIRTIKIVDFGEFLLEVGFLEAEIESIIDDLNCSDICFGTNPDTLLDAKACNELIVPYGITVPESYNDVWFSLGC